MWERRNEIDFPTNLEYMMEHIDRFALEDFVPTNTDVLYARQRTTGVVETQFTVRSFFGSMARSCLLGDLSPPSTLFLPILTMFPCPSRSTPSSTGP